jgi:mono/diheme cytochrome c family protein
VAAIGEPAGARSVTRPARRDEINGGGARVFYASVSLASAALCLAPVFTIVLAAHDPITTRVTWTGDISRIVQARCVTCHAPDARGPMSLATYEDARPWAGAIKEEVMTRRMPKWHAVRGYGDFSNDPSLSPFEIALIAAWANGGAPKGTAADAKTILAVTPIAKPNRDIEPSIGARDITLPCG